MSPTVTEYTVSSARIAEPLTLALVADLHNGPYEAYLPVLADADAILILGDLVDRHRRGFANSLRFLEDAPKCAPTFYAIGNHEWKFKERDAYWPRVLQSRVTVLDNEWTPFRGLALGALSSALTPDPAFLPEMARQPGFRLLMCHHPEYFGRYVASHAIDLTLSGHAHGGQIELFGRGLYAPGQGIFPRLTHGFYHDGRLLVSRGMTNSARAPRLNNPCELVLLRLRPDDGGEYHGTACGAFASGGRADAQLSAAQGV